MVSVNLKSLNETITGFLACDMRSKCDVCPYVDTDDCVGYLNDDILYYLRQYKKLTEPTVEEQPFLPGLEPKEPKIETTFEDKLERIADVLKVPHGSAE